MYMAVIEFEPKLRVEVVNVATPAPFNVTSPRGAPPLKKVTSPVGVPSEAVTVAVNVTDWPKLDGFGDEVTDVVDVAAATAGFTA